MLLLGMDGKDRTMTKVELKDTSPIELRAALQLAFDAGCAYAIASHKDFVQIHEPCRRVVETLAFRVRPNTEMRGGE